MVITIRRKPLSPLARQIDEFIEAGRDLVNVQRGRGGEDGTVTDLATAQKRFVKAHEDVTGLRTLLDASDEFSRGYTLSSEMTGKGATEDQIDLAEKVVDGLYDKLETALDRWPAADDDDEVERVVEVSIKLSPEDMYDLLEAGVFSALDVVDNLESSDLADAVNNLERWARDVAQKLGVDVDLETNDSVEQHATREHGNPSPSW